LFYVVINRIERIYRKENHRSRREYRRHLHYDFAQLSSTPNKTTNNKL